MIELENECEIFFFLIAVFLALYAAFMAVVVILEYILYKRDCKRFDEKFKHKS